MLRSFMRTTLPTLLLAAIALLIGAQGAAAQPAPAQAQPGHYPFRSPDDSAAVIALVERYLGFTRDNPIAIDSIGAYAVEEFATWLQKSHGLPVRFPEKMPYRIVGARSVRDDGSLLSIALATDADSL